MTKKKAATKTASSDSGTPPSAPASAVQLPELNVGDLVEIFGLQGAKELNGRRGRIVKYVEETSRFGVRLNGDDEVKAVKPANLQRIDPPEPEISLRSVLEKELVDVVNKIKSAEEKKEEKGHLQSRLSVLIKELKQIEETEEAARPKPEARPEPKPVSPTPDARARRSTPPASPLPLQPPPLPSEQHHPLPKKEPPSPPKEAQPSPSLMTTAPLFQPSAQLGGPRREPRAPVPAPPPVLPERPVARMPTGPKLPPLYMDENEYPDPALAKRSAKVAAAALLCGIVTSQADLFPATWFIWTYLLIHLLGVIFLTDYAGESGLVALCASFGLHAGVALSELLLWTLDKDGEDSVGPWSLLVLFSSVMYVHSFWTECLTLPPDYITSISLFFPMFPAFNAAVAMSCLELFLEWRYFPEHKIWMSAAALGSLLMVAGQTLIFKASRTADRNFWASCRNMPEDEEKPEDFAGLEVPDRKVVQEGAFAWERHPAYLGAMLWGVGMQVALCNPVMLLIVSFVLWASLLYVALEEEQELYDEFKGGYANYAALTPCWIPLFNSFLENAYFQREMADNAEECADDVDQEDFDEEAEEEDNDDCASENDMLPTWEGVPKGGALWNRQFREPWMLG